MSIAEHDVLWRQLDRHFWVGIAEDGHLGTIEEGRRFIVVDTDGRIRGRCSTLDHAKALLAAIHDLGRAERSARRRPTAA